MPPKPSFYAITYTVTDVAGQASADDTIIFEDVNIYIADKAIYYGDGVRQTAVGAVGGVLYYRNLRISDFFCKNAVTGQIATISIVGTLKGAV